MRVAHQSAVLGGLILIVALGASSPPTHADPSRYPMFAQQKPAGDVKPAFISVDQLVTDVTAGKKPVIVDVRTAEEYREAHILGAISAPLAEFKSHMRSMPRNRPVVLY